MAEVEKKDDMEKPMEEKPTSEVKPDAEMKDVKETPEEPKEKEEDSPEDSSARYGGVIELSTVGSSMNCVISKQNVVDSLPIEGANYVADARANIGLTGGRYFYEIEVLAVRGAGAEVLIGFSCAGSNLFLGDKESVCFSSFGGYVVDGSKVTSNRNRRFGKDDVVGVLLNRTENGYANTISLFVNGVRMGKPEPLPESFDGALIPHISVKMCMVAVNLTKTISKELPFKVRLVGDASADDVVATATRESSEHKVVMMMGIDCAEYVQNYVEERAGENIVQITAASINKWQEKSCLQKRPLDHDSLRWLERMMTLRKGHYIHSIGHNLLASDRALLAKRLSAGMKKVMVVDPSIIGKLPFTTSFAKDVSLPTEEEGFVVLHTEGENKSKVALEQWQKRCKLQCIVPDLKVGTFFKENWAKWEKIREATREEVEKQKKEQEEAEKLAAGEIDENEKEGEKKEEEKKEEEKKEDEKKDGEEKALPSDVDCKEFSEEDWMLLDLRIVLHLLIHAFREDVEDKDRHAFAAEHLPHYYKLYHENKKMFSLPTWGVKTVADCVDIISDTVEVEDGMLSAKLDKTTSFDMIVQQTEEARLSRSDLICAGDEGAVLKFKAPPKRAPVKGKGASRGAPKPQSYSNTRSKAGYEMRPIPNSGASFKRTGNFQQSAPKRRY